MKRNHIIRVGWISGLTFMCFGGAMSQDEVPCLIFTGNSDKAECLDLSKFNRIKFEDDEMIISSSGINNPEVKLLYSYFNHIEIGEAIPTGSMGVDHIESNDITLLRYRPDTKTLTLESSAEKQYSIGIFSLKGTLLATSNLRGGQSLNLESLTAGAYIVLATNGKEKTSLKIILN